MNVIRPARFHKLDDASAEVREKAFTELVGMGPKVASLLRQTAANTNPRIDSLAVKCLQLIEKTRPSAAQGGGADTGPARAGGGRRGAFRLPPLRRQRRY